MIQRYSYNNEDGLYKSSTGVFAYYKDVFKEIKQLKDMIHDLHEELTIWRRGGKPKPFLIPPDKEAQ